MVLVLFFHHTATTYIYTYLHTLARHDALPILRIKAFFGTSANALKTQVWIAVSVYVLIAIVRKRCGSRASLYEWLQILSVTLFEQTPLDEMFAAPARLRSEEHTSELQSLMRISYAVFCLQKKNKQTYQRTSTR